MSTAIAFVVGLVFGTGFGFIVCAVTIYENKVKGESDETYDTCYIEEGDM